MLVQCRRLFDSKALGIARTDLLLPSSVYLRRERSRTATAFLHPLRVKPAWDFLAALADLGLAGRALHKEVRTVASNRHLPESTLLAVEPHEGGIHA